MLMVACSLQYFLAARQLNDKKHIVSERHWFFKLGRCSTKWVTIDCVYSFCLLCCSGISFATCQCCWRLFMSWFLSQTNCQLLKHKHTLWVSYSRCVAYLAGLRNAEPIGSQILKCRDIVSHRYLVRPSTSGALRISQFISWFGHIPWHAEFSKARKRLQTRDLNKLVMS